MADQLSIGAAAELVGKSKSTIRRWIKEGKIGGVDGPDGTLVPRAELEALGLVEPEKAAAAGKALDPTDVPGRLDALTSEVELLRREVTKLRKQLELVLVARMKASTPWWKRLF